MPLGLPLLCRCSAAAPACFPSCLLSMRRLDCRFGCCCSAAAPACLPSCLLSWPLFVSLCLSCLAGCGSGLPLGLPLLCRCSAAAPACLPSCLLSMRLLWIAAWVARCSAAAPGSGSPASCLLLLCRCSWIVSLHVAAALAAALACLPSCFSCLASCGSGLPLWLLLLCRCSCLSPFMFVFLAFLCLPLSLLFGRMWLWIAAWVAAALPLLLLVSLHVCSLGLFLSPFMSCLSGLMRLWIAALVAAALPLLLLVSLHVCFSWPRFVSLCLSCLASCGSGLPLWLPLLCRCSCLSPFMFAVLASFCLPLSFLSGLMLALGCRCSAAAPACLPSCLLSWPPFRLPFVSHCLALCGSGLTALVATALPLFMLVSLHVCCLGLLLSPFVSLVWPNVALDCRFGCRCSAAAPACLPSCLLSWPPFVYLCLSCLALCGSGLPLWLPLLCRCSAAAPACLLRVCSLGLLLSPVVSLVWPYVALDCRFGCRCPAAAHACLPSCLLSVWLWPSYKGFLLLYGRALDRCFLCRCSAAAHACLPSCLPCWPLFPFMLAFACLPLFSFVSLVWSSCGCGLRFAAAALPLLLLVSLHVCFTLPLSAFGKSLCVSAPRYLGSMLV